MKKEKRKEREKENSWVMNSQLGHWVQGGETILKWGNICRTSKETDWVAAASMVTSVSDWGDSQVYLVCFLRSAFLKIIIMSLKFPRHYSHFLSHSCLENEVWVSAPRPLSRLPTRPLGDYLNTGGLRWKPPREGACPRREAALGGEQCLLVLTLLCCDSNSHLSSFSEV